MISLKKSPCGINYQTGKQPCSCALSSGVTGAP